MASEESNTDRTTSRSVPDHSTTGLAQRCSLDPDIHDQLLAWWEEGLTGAAVARGLKRQFPDRAPHENTVRKEIQRHAADKSGAWTLADTDFDTEAARLVLAELGAVYHLSGGQRRHFTKREAWWIARLKSVHNRGGADWTPLEPGQAFRMAVNHVAAERRGEQLSPWLDAIEVGEASLHVHLGHRNLFAPKETK